MIKYKLTYGTHVFEVLVDSQGSIIEAPDKWMLGYKVMSLKREGYKVEALSPTDKDLDDIL